MKKELFEEQLRKSYEKYEGSVQPQSWGKIEQGLNTSFGGWKWGKILGTLGIASAVVLAGWGLWNASPTGSVSQSLSLSSSNSTQENSSALSPISGSNIISDGHESTTAEHSGDLSTTPSPLSLPRVLSSQGSATPSHHPLPANGASSSGIEISQNTTALGVQKNTDGTSAVVNSVSNSLSNIRQTCAGTEVSFKPQSGPTDGSYLWNFGDGAFSSEPNPKHRFLKPGTYEVSLSVTDNKNAQINTVNMSETITILPNPSADFDWSFINGSKEAPTVEIKNLSTNAVSAHWNFADGSESVEKDPIKSFTNKGSHSVMITAVNEYGCKDQRIKYININSDYNLNAPGFVHCGEGFMPEGLMSAKGKISLTVYDGAKKIFETKSNKTPWYCSDSSGNKVEPNKQYPWIAIIHDAKTGEDRYYSGAVLVKP